MKQNIRSVTVDVCIQTFVNPFPIDLKTCCRIILQSKHSGKEGSPLCVYEKLKLYCLYKSYNLIKELSVYLHLGPVCFDHEAAAAEDTLLTQHGSY